MQKYKGRLLIVSGGEGGGKSTNAKRAAKEFGDRVLYTREPGGSALAEQIRALFLSGLAQEANPGVRLLLAFTGRLDHMQRTILTALDAGKLVICDRFDSDTFAYQIRAEGGARWANLFEVLRAEILAETKPDLYVHFDIEPAVGIARKLDQGAKEQNAIDRRPLTFHHQVHEGLKEFMARTDIVSVRIDAENGPEEVWKKFKEIVGGQLRFIP